MAGPDIAIRLAVKDDAPLLPVIERSAGIAFRSVPGLEWIADDDVASAEFHQIYIDENTVWVAVLKGVKSDERLIGFITTATFGPVDGDTLHIWELAVTNGHQGQGVGRRLMKSAKEYATENGFDALTLTTFRDLAFNELFYHKLGYKTLASDQLTPRLADILKAEIEDGLPAERRCAMQLQLDSVHSSKM